MIETMRDDLYYFTKKERLMGEMRGGTGDWKVPPEGVRLGVLDVSKPGFYWPRSVEQQPDTAPRSDD